VTGWKLKKISEVCDLIVDCVNKTAPSVSYPTAYKMIRTPNIRDGRINLEDCRFVDEETYKKWTRRATVDEGDVLLTREAPMGEVGRVGFKDTVFLGQRIVQYRANAKELDSHFLLYSFRSAFLQAQFRKYDSSGSIVSHIPVPACTQFQIPTPPLPTQKKIAQVLSTLDAKIELNYRINQELEALAKLLYDYWFVQFDFPISATQAMAMGKPELEGKPYRASGGKMIFNEKLKREIPEGWSDGSLEELGKIVGGSTPNTEISDNFCANGTPWITPKDLSDNMGNRFIDRGALDVTSQGIKSASLKIHPDGTVLMSSRAPIGYLAIARNPVTTNQGFKSIVPGDGFSSDYIFFTLQHFMNLIKANASGSTFKEISGGTLKAVRIHLPPADLVTEFTKAFSSFSNQQSLLEQQNQDLTQLRDWLLPMLMNGQVTVG